MSIPNKTGNRRNNPRFALNVAVRYGTDGTFDDGELVDVGAGGLGIIGKKTYPCGTELELRFRSRTSDKDLLSVRAVVRHSVHSKRMGMEFINLPTSDFSRTLAMIERLTSSQNKPQAVTA